MSKMTRLLGALAACLAGHVAVAQTAKPNILVIFGDDVGYWNVSAYNAGMMGYQTPNIDRIANEGAIFTDAYAQWRFERIFLLAPAQVYVKNWLESFNEFPPRQKPGSFNLSDAMDKLGESGG